MATKFLSCLALATQLLVATGVSNFRSVNVRFESAKFQAEEYRRLIDPTTTAPSLYPSVAPSFSPSAAPSFYPSVSPSYAPSPAPTSTSAPSTVSFQILDVTQTFYGIDEINSQSSAFKENLVTVLINLLGLPSKTVVVKSVTHIAVPDSTTAMYTITLTNFVVSAVKANLASKIRSGNFTIKFSQAGYPTVTATDLPSYSDRSPTASPVSPVVGAVSCFAGTETVDLENGVSKFISDVRVGDRVLAATSEGKTVYSEVVYVPHRKNNQRTTFARITTESGRDVQMTLNHILPAGVCGAALPLVYSSKVAVGDCIQTVSGEEKVFMVENVQGNGAYTIVTKEEYIVVNGIIASPFGANHMMANMYYNVHRFIYAISPTILQSNFLHAANERLGMVIPFFGATSA